ncbi:MAG: type II secretion system protein GspK [Methylococcales bacterium]|nr:type II secretion system protein GspK [Methylococcales bacterium]
MKKTPPSQKGVALILVLWVLTLLIIMAGSFTLGMRRETRIIANLRDKAQAIALAEAGITFAQLNLSTLDKAQRWRASGHIYPVQFNQATIRVKIQSEFGKIDINKANEKLLTGMLLQTDIAPEKHPAIVNAIIDWRDKDDLIRIDGAEKATYQSEGLAYAPRNKPFQTIEELRLVLGVTPELFEQLKTMITVYSRQLTVDLKTASRAVLLAATGLEAERIDSYIAERVESDINHLPTPALITTGTQSKKNAQEIYTVIAETQLNNGAKARIQVVMKKKSDPSKPFIILDWKRYAALKTSLFSKTMSLLLIPEDAELNP